MAISRSLPLNKAINKLFELGYKHGFYDAPVHVEDFMIPTEYEELRNS